MLSDSEAYYKSKPKSLAINLRIRGTIIIAFAITTIT